MRERSRAQVRLEIEALVHLAATSPRGVPEVETDAAAYRLGYSPGHVRRLVAAAMGPRRPSPWEVGEWLLPLWYAHGNLTALHCDLTATRAELIAAGLEVPDELADIPAAYSSFWRAFDRLPARFREFPRTGANGVRRRLLSLRWEAAARNEVWQADCCKLDIWILPRGARKPVRPWLILFLDDATRLVVGATVCLAVPGAEEAAAGCARALRLKVAPDGHTLYGGRPQRILWDNGAEFRNTLMTTLALTAGFAGTPVLRHTPTHKGKVERFFGTFQRWVLMSLPGYGKSPRDHQGAPVFLGDPADLMSDAELFAHLSERIDTYNWQRPHRALGGRTPGEVWAADPTALVEVPAEAIRGAVLRATRLRVAAGDGVTFRGTRYLAVDEVYDDWIGQRLEVGYLPHDRSFVELFGPKGRWLCTAYEQSTFSAEELYALVHRRAEQADQINAAVRVARQIRLERAAAIDPDSGRLPSLVATSLARRTHSVAAPGLPGPAPVLAPDEEWLAASRRALGPRR